MSTVLGKLKKKSIVITATLFLSTTTALAADINLSQIEIHSAQQNGYNIVLKTDKKADFKKSLQGDNKLVIELKNTAATEDFSTIYNDVATINNITVLPSGKDDLKIQIQGSEVQNSNVSVDYQNAQVATVSQNFDPEQINLSLPMDNYKPVYDENEMEVTEEANTASSVLSKLFPSNNSNEEIPSQNKSGTNWLTYLGLGIIIITAGKNLLKPNKEAQIGLTQTFKERERELAEKLNTGVRETLSLRNRAAQNASAPSINYAVRSYQNSQKNPYEATTPISTLRPVKKSATATYTKPAVKAAVHNNLATQTTQRYTQSPISTSQQGGNVDSMKFLESMTKIYEKNGRSDLAMGLKNNMKKVNI